MASLAQLHPVSEFQAHEAPVNHVVKSPDGWYMATADTEMRVRVWSEQDLVTEIDVHNLLDKIRPTERVRGLAFSPDGEMLYVAAGEWLNGYQLSNSKCDLSWSYVSPRLFGFLIVSPTSVAVVDGKIAAAFDNGMLSYFQPSGNIISQYKHNAAPRRIVPLADGTFAGTDSFSISTWSHSSKKPLTHRQIRERIYGFDATRNGEFVAVRHLFATCVISTESGEEVARFNQGRGLPLTAFSPSGEALAIGTQHVIDVYGLARGVDSLKLIVQDAELISLGYANNGRNLLAGCSDGKIRTWEMAASREV